MKNILLTILSFTISALSYTTQAQTAATAETLESLANKFASPPDVYKPHAWWHWLGSNFSKSGMTRDLEAMKTAGVGGVVVFNAPSWLDPAHNPWRDHTYRSDAYWDALGHALKEAKRLNMEVGIHNTPGWSTTGGPWISPEKDGMKAATFDTVKVQGGKQLSLELPTPQGDFYKDVAVLAVPDRKDLSVNDVVDLTANFTGGILKWDAPQGDWKIYRFGYYSTLQRSHPAPEDVEATAFEADKMSPEATVKHWNSVLTPFKERFGEYIGTTFNYIWIDSYEAWGQSWTPNLRAEFIRMKGYDPVPQIILAYQRGDRVLHKSTKGIEHPRDGFALETVLFLNDYKEVTNRLFMNCWQIGKDMVNAAGFQLCFEPYGSIIAAPFDMEEGVSVADIPVTEFWVHSGNPSGDAKIAETAALYQKRIVGAEAFTGMEATCRFTETPAMLKRPADMGYSYGVNRYYLHSWAHNPFDDKYQPGFSFAHYGTHFSRNQTWFEPGKAFFTYLARCQMLLQQGSFVSRISDEVLMRRTPEADIFFLRNTGDAQEKTFVLPVAGSKPELWDAYTGTVSTTSNYSEKEPRQTSLTLKMEKDASIFAIFPRYVTKYPKTPEQRTVKETTTEAVGAWTVNFAPKTDEKPFKRTFAKLDDFSKLPDDAVKYFSGTATYQKTFTFSKADLSAGKRVVLDLGKVCDIAALEINGQDAGVLWTAPFRTDITKFLKAGSNVVKIKVSNTWVNRLIGDEQYPEDFEWTDRNQGLRAMKYLPDWFVKDEPRPVRERKTFVPWYYYRKDSRLQPAGLLGPVSIVKQNVE